MNNFKEIDKTSLYLDKIKKLGIEPPHINKNEEIDTESLYLNIATDEIYKNMCRRVGEYMNYVRENKGISLREMYRQTNVSIAVLSDLENGQKLPRYETLIKLTLALDIPLEIIFGEQFTPSFKCDDTSIAKPRTDETIRNTLLNAGFNKSEVKEIINFMEFTKSKRGK